MASNVKYRVTERYYNNGTTSATIRMIYEPEPLRDKCYPDYDQYEEDFTTEAAAMKCVKAVLNA